MLIIVSESLGRSQVVTDVVRELSLSVSYFGNVDTLERLMGGESRRFVVLGEQDISNEVVSDIENTRLSRNICIRIRGRRLRL